MSIAQTRVVVSISQTRVDILLCPPQAFDIKNIIN